MFNRGNILIVLALGLLLFAIFYFITDASAQILQPDLALRLTQDEQGYMMVCYVGCSWYNALGTTEEINRHFPEYHCAVNWAYFLRNRYYGVNFLGYLTGPNGDTSNPLCEN